MVKSISINDKWALLKTPNRNNLSLLQFNDTNLWFSKNSKNDFGLLISECFGLVENKYKNIEIEWKAKIVNYHQDRTLQNCLILNFSNKINKDLLINLIDSKPFNREKNIYTSIDINNLLKELEKITQKDNYDYNEVIGVWGELYFLNKIISKCNKKENIFKIINSWEGVDDRNIIDFTFNFINSKVEVKTTTKELRMHVFHDILQLSINKEWIGLVASVCIEQNEAGITCFNLFNQILNNLDSKNLSYFKKKIEIRGICCYDNNFYFEINSNKELQLYDFNLIPKPILTEGVGKIQWESVIENIHHLNDNEKENFYNKFSF